MSEEAFSNFLHELDGCIGHILHLKKRITSLDQDLADDIEQQFEIISQHVADIAYEMDSYAYKDDAQQKIEILKYEISELQKAAMDRQEDIASKLHNLQRLQKAWDTYTKNSA